MSTMYKLIPWEFYRNGSSFNTSEINYTKSIGAYDENLSQFLDAVLLVSKSSRMSFKNLIIITNNIKINFAIKNHFREVLLSKIDPIPYPKILLSGSTNDSITRRDLKYLFEIITDHNITFSTPLDIAKFWEYLYEKVRQEKFPDCPSRLASYFSFKHPESIEYYQENHRMNGMKCILDITECHTIFECDMLILDQIDITYSYQKAEEIIRKYWQQD
jgi:hypothetical protein